MARRKLLVAVSATERGKLDALATLGPGHPRHPGPWRPGALRTEYLDHLDYRVDEQLREPFAKAIRLDSTRLAPGYSGIRPKLAGLGEPAADFLIQTASDHGLPGLINLFGIESPGLTASLAIAERVARNL